MNRACRITLCLATSLILAPSAFAVSCGSALEGPLRPGLSGQYEIVRIYTPRTPNEGRAMVVAIAADIFGELHRLNAESPEAFAHFVALIQLAEREESIGFSLDSIYTHPYTGKTVADEDRVNLWEALAEKTQDLDVGRRIKQTKLLKEDGHILPFVKDVLEASMAEIKYPTIDDLFTGSGRAFEVIPTNRLADRLRYAPDQIARVLHNPLGQELAIPKPVSYDFPSFDYSKHLSF